MPDEALRSSLQGRPRQAPDFSPLALQHLHSSCLAVRQLVKQYLNESGSVQLDSLKTAVAEIHSTLQLLDKQGAVLVTTELSLLLDAMSSNQSLDDNACAHTLVFAGERLADYVAHLQKPGAADSALPLLPVINNCRACRDEELMSEMLVVASGIDLPDASALPLPLASDIALFQKHILESREPLTSGLLGWFTDKSKLQASLNELQLVFASLAASCDAPTALQPLAPLFESAEFVCQSVQTGALDNSAAIHTLFAQLERLLDSYSKLEETDTQAFSKAVPDRLFLNLLYYVALSSHTTPKAVALRRRFRLDRFIDRGIGSDRSPVEFEGVGDRLADSIRDAIELETEAARTWLDGEQINSDETARIAARLAQLEPAIMLLGAHDSLQQLSIINEEMVLLSGENVSLDDPLKERIAEALIRLERALDTELNAIRAKSNQTGQSDLESILSACLHEAQLRLINVEAGLIKLFPSQFHQESTDLDKTFPLHIDDSDESERTRDQVLASLSEINSALQILPLPEVSPLITGVQSFIQRNQTQPVSNSAFKNLATVMVSLGFYLNSVFQANGAAGQLLLEAEEALLQLDMDDLEINDETLVEANFDLSDQFESTTALDSTQSVGIDEYDATLVETDSDTEVDRFTDLSLEQMGIIGDAIAGYRTAVDHDDSMAIEKERLRLSAAFDVLAIEAQHHSAQDLHALAKANVVMLGSGTTDLISGDRDSDVKTLLLLDESLAVLPQLINQLQSHSDKVYGFDSLLARLGAPVVPVAGDLTREIDEVIDEVSDETLADVDEDDFAQTISVEDEAALTFDSTLQQVFFRECEQHMRTLRKSVTDALSSRSWGSDSDKAAFVSVTQTAGVTVSDIEPARALPNRDMLRALHTLTGSAQTVEAAEIIELSQPLQKAALNKQRSAESFSRAETEYIRELLDIMDARLQALENDEPISDNAESIKLRLSEFVSRSEPWVPERKSGLQLNTNVGVVESVFQEEARELLSALRLEALRLPDDEQREDAIARMQSCLHTLKGSARMAGQSALADRAHSLEDDISLADGITLDSVVDVGLSELQTLMLVEADAVPADAEPTTSEPMGLTESAFDNLLSLATRATVSQSKLSGSMLRLRDVYADIESTTSRLQALSQHALNPSASASSSDSAAGSAANATAIAEMLSDLDNARRMFADALLDAEAEQKQGARADTALHQTLIRTQLVSMDEAQTRLQYAIDDAASETEKSVEFELSGGELTIDKSTFKGIITPLEHLVRNAVVHGIEAPAERIASGKAKRGKILFDTKIDGTDLLLSITDDGIGLDQHAVAQALESAGMPVDSTLDDICTALCQPGFTTIAEADQLGGRGMGLSSVKQAVEKLQGSLHLSLPDAGGLRFAIRLPQRIRMNQVVLVEAGSACYAIPVNFVQHVCEDQQEALGADLQYDEEDYTYTAFTAVLNGGPSSGQLESSDQFVLVKVGERNLALCVDKVLGYREIIAQPLGSQMMSLNRYIGGSVLTDGTAVLIPDFNRLLNSNRANSRNASLKPATVRARKTALVIDDSVTMRIAAEQMLMGLDFQPSMVRDGAEAIEWLQRVTPDVLLVDIDMPRMNGFDFLRHYRLQEPDHDVPVIMISTRDTQQDRQEAKRLGAVDYLVKPYSEAQLIVSLQKQGLL